MYCEFIDKRLVFFLLIINLVIVLLSNIPYIFSNEMNDAKRHTYNIFPRNYEKMCTL